MHSSNWLNLIVIICVNVAGVDCKSVVDEHKDNDENNNENNDKNNDANNDKNTDNKNNLGINKPVIAAAQTTSRGQVTICLNIFQKNAHSIFGGFWPNLGVLLPGFCQNRSSRTHPPTSTPTPSPHDFWELPYNQSSH